MIKFNFLNPIFIITVTCFFITIVFSIIFLTPKFQEIEKTKECIISTKQLLEKKEVYFLKVKKYKTELKNHQEELSKITPVLGDSIEASLPSLFKFIQEASNETGLILTKINPFIIHPLKEKPKIKKIQLDFQVKGHYVSFKNFLVALERSNRIISIENIYFSSPEKGNLFIFNIIISAHSY